MADVTSGKKRGYDQEAEDQGEEFLMLSAVFPSWEDNEADLLF